MIIRALALAFAGLLAAMPACAGQAADADGQVVRVTDPHRIVSLGGPVSEIVAALGRAGDVVAVDTTTRVPETLADRPRVGYLRALAAEGLLSQAPDLVIAQNDAGPDIVLQQVAAAGVPVLRLPAATDVGGLEDVMRRIAAVLDRPEAGSRLIESLRQGLYRLPPSVGADAPQVAFLLIGHGGTPMAAGRNTPVDAILSLAGLRNAFSGMEGWKPISQESLLAAGVDGLVLSSQGVESVGGLAKVMALPLLTGLPDLNPARVVTLDATLLQGLGPRTPEAAATLAKVFGTGGRSQEEAAR